MMKWRQNLISRLSACSRHLASYRPDLTCGFWVTSCDRKADDSPVPYPVLCHTHTHTHASTHIDAPRETHKICWPPDLLASSDSTICLVPESGRSVEKRKREERKDRKWKKNGGNEKQRKRKRAWLEWAQAKRGREMGKETEEESNLLKGLKVWVGLTHHPLAKMNAHVSSSCVCRDERWTRFQHRPQGGVKKSEIVKYSVETWQHDTAVELPCCMVSPQTFNGRLLACPPYRTLSSLR